MLRLLKEIEGYQIQAVDGVLGSAHDFLFSDQDWNIRYLVVDTGNWLPGRRVLIYTGALDQPNWSQKLFPVNLTKDAIEKSPHLDAHKPVSRQHEMELFRHYKWVPYWAPAPGAIPPVAPVEGPDQVDQSGLEEETDPHLRSFREVCGYHVETADNKRTGHVEDFVVNDEDWIARYFVVDTRDFLPGKRVLLATEWAQEIWYKERVVRFDVKENDIKEGPEFDPNLPVNRETEERLYDFYGRPVYWQDSEPPPVYPPA